MRCFIAAGHGPKADGSYDPGNVWAEPGGTITEEHLIVDLAARTMARALSSAEPHLVPRGGLRQRIEYVNRWSRPGDIAIEIHANSASNEGVKGAETFYAASSQRGQALASHLHARLVRIGRVPRGPKPDSQSHWSSLAWVRRTKPWAVLVELGFLSNLEDREWLTGGGAIDAGVALALAVDEWP